MPNGRDPALPWARPRARRAGRLAGALLSASALAACGATPGPDSVPPPPSVPAATPPSVPAATPPSAPAATPSSSAPPTPAAPAGSSTPGSSPQAPAAAELPRGGTEVFPRYRLVGYAGLTGASTLGRLGTGPLDQRVAEMERRARPYAKDGREILPVVEVIATVVQAAPGRDGLYRARIADDQIARYVKAARKRRAIVLLNIQPGRSEFIDEVRAYERWLREPDVGVALDPEWAMGPNQVPGRVYGRTTGAELDQVARYLSGLVSKHRLPEKVMVYHQVARSVVRDESKFKDRPGVAVIKSVDGIGSPAQKTSTYRLVNKTTPKFVHPGFKLFYDEDSKGAKLMTPEQVMALKPRPEYVLYE